MLDDNTVSYHLDGIFDVMSNDLALLNCALLGPINFPADLVSKDIV